MIIGAAPDGRRQEAMPFKCLQTGDHKGPYLSPGQDAQPVPTALAPTDSPTGCRCALLPSIDVCWFANAIDGKMASTRHLANEGGWSLAGVAKVKPCHYISSVT